MSAHLVQHRPQPPTGRNTTPLSTPALPKLLLTVEEAAQHINMSPRYVRRLVAERRIVFYRVGRAVRLAPADLSAHVNSGRVEPITPTTVWTHLRSVA
jgi:excisionase family DNA binding protein